MASAKPTKVKKLDVCGLLAALFLGATAAAQGPSSANYDESKAGIFTLPDPLVFTNGKPVRTARDWEKRRRELLRLFEADVYGRNPSPPKQIGFKVFDLDERALGGKAIRKQVTVSYPTRKGDAHEDLLIYLPATAPKPVPMILTLNFSGNQAVTDDPAVKLPTIWTSRTHERQVAPEESRGRDKEFDIAKILARGYGFATLCYQNIEPDFKDGYKDGIIAMFFKAGETQPGPGDWGAIGAWAYGLSRAMDYLEKDPEVDAKRVAIMGHSRLGKTVLWAAALDRRFAMVLSSCSGRGGASLWRRNYGETLLSMSSAFPYWFCRNLMSFVGRVDDLPVDSHELIALAAPRPVYVTAAEDDKWADPRGEFLACVGAGPVYRLLGAGGLEADQMPPLNEPILHRLAFHIRTGKHAVTEFDWDQFLKFADEYLHGPARGATNNGSP